jgi:TRAP-type uncharacterized transport system substrate-binding protein
MPKRRFARRWLPAGLLLLAAIVSIRLVDPQIPNEIYLLTGPKGSAFFQDGQRYGAYLAGRGVTAHIVETGGTLENLQRILSDTTSAPQVGFAEAGSELLLPDPAVAAEHLESLGSLYIEPLWLFLSVDRPFTSARDLRGLRIAAGPVGGIAHPFARLLRDNGVLDEVELIPFEAAGDTTVEVLLASGVDGVWTAGEPGSPALDSLIASPDLRLVGFRRASAYDRRWAYLADIELPEGTLDLARNIPSENLPLIAGAVNLVARNDLPAALNDVLLDAAREIHKAPSLFSDRRAFPNPDNVSLPLSHAADSYYEKGPSLLNRVFPFWLATLVDRFRWAIATFAGSLFALVGLLPKLLSVRFNRTSRKLYRRLERIDKGLSDGDRGAFLAELEEIDVQSAALRVPHSQRASYFELRQNIHDLRDRVTGSRSASVP